MPRIKREMIIQPYSDTLWLFISTLGKDILYIYTTNQIDLTRWGPQDSVQLVYKWLNVTMENNFNVLKPWLCFLRDFPVMGGL